MRDAEGSPLHRLLTRQLEERLGPGQSLPPELAPLFAAISEAYRAADEDRLRLERAVEETRRELLERNRQLRAELSERHRQEREVTEIIEAAPYGIAIRRERRWIYVNPALANFLGYGPGELTGCDPLTLLHPEDRARAAERIKRSEANEEPLRSQEFRFLRRDGEIALLEVAPVRPVQFDGAPARLVVARDVTESKKMRARLLLADRMASIGTLAAGVAHEINNPLSYVVANVEYASQGIREIGRDRPELAAAASELGEALADARQGADRVRQIVRDLKTFSRADEVSNGPVEVRRVLESTINMAWNEIRHRARLVKDYAEIPAVSANEGRLCQVFLNLLINAAQAISEGDIDRNEIRLKTYTDAAGRAAIEVRDTGLGISPEHLSRLFDPFFTTKPVGVGTGLGLSICHGIVTELGGEIEVESRLGAGSCFRVLLPPAPRYAAAPAPDPAAPAARGRLLVIDDEPLVGISVRRLLAQLYEVEVATDAPAALELLLGGAEFDVILCDLMMPEMGGADLYEALERRAPEHLSKIVFLTGGAFTPRAAAFLERVDAPKLEKPFDRDALAAILAARRAA
jgi:PAS domain S-box-containing protein